MFRVATKHTGAMFGRTPQLFVGTMPYSGDSRYKPEDMHKTVLSNLKAGVRHIDTAEMYAEVLQFVGLAIKDSRIPRNQLFISTKLNGLPSGDYQEVEKHFTEHLASMKLDYVDLLLIHWPGARTADLSKDPDSLEEELSWETFDKEIDSAWENMIKLKDSGRVKRIGISNFYSQHLQRLLKSPGVEEEPPVANQIYIDATEHQMEYVEAMQRANIQVIAYRPLQFLSALKTASEMGDSVYPELTALQKRLITSSYSFSSVQQFVLSWLCARGIHVCVKSSNHTHIKENLQAIQKGAQFPKEAINQFPEATELSTMLLAYDVFASKLQTIGID